MQDYISEAAWSISPPHSICFQPAMEKPVSQSAPRCTINKYSKPSPLTTYTFCLPNIASTDFLPQPRKRRKLSIPPSVDYFASTVTTLPTPAATAASPASKTPGLGSHIWYKYDPKTSEARWFRVKASGTTEFKVVRTPRDFDFEYKLLNTKTGKEMYMKFSEEDAAFFFKT